MTPQQPEGGWGVSANSLGPEVCLAANFRPKEGDMVLNVKDGPVTMPTNVAVLSTVQKTYFYAGFTNRTIHSCELHNTSSNNYNIDLCADFHPEKAKLNFFLLVMNGVRMVFTKTLAFNTLLTIRAVLL